MAIILPADGLILNFLGGGEPGRLHCMDILGSGFQWRSVDLACLGSWIPT